ncbi:MAG: ABC transporter ATP-binding protein, partial [Clostridia bacterium]|nr:ABC transporter ATP-binding protein [Pyramidobacter sp.]MBQ9188510.1 ABC transporter ATP-binding protein [Clostridia bacterium]
MWKLIRYMRRRDRGFALLCLLLVAGQVYFDLTMPDFMSDITKLIVTPGSAMADIWIAGGKMLACAAGSAALSVIVGWLAATIAADFSYSVREGVFTRVTDFGAEEMKRFSTASLITRTTNDITQIQMVVSFGLQAMIKAPIMAVWAILKIVGKSWELSLATAGAVVLLLVVILSVMAFVMPKFKIMQKQIDEVNRVTRENLTGLRIVRAFNAEPYQEAKFETSNDNLMRTMLFTSRSMAVLMPFVNLVMQSVSLMIYWLGAVLIEGVPLTAPAERVALFAEIVVFSSYAMYVIMSFMMLIMIFMMLPRAAVSAGRINEVLETDPAVKEGTNGEAAPEHGTVSFGHVSFRYPDAAENCLTDISFTAKPGETVAFIGSTGSGKTTLVSLVARLFDATEGVVKIDGRDVKDYTFAALYDRVGFIAQKAQLFSGTVRENLTFGRTGAGITEDDWRAALEIAQAKDFVEGLPNGADG